MGRIELIIQTASIKITVRNQEKERTRVSKTFNC
jgi:hypothetical protein